jgi:hypothetical protein
MRIESWVGVVAMFWLFSAGDRRQRQCRRSFLPANVFLLHDIEQPLQRIYERAPSFRAVRSDCRGAGPAGHRAGGHVCRVAAERLPSCGAPAVGCSLMCTCGRVRIMLNAYARGFEHILEQIKASICATCRA